MLQSFCHRRRYGLRSVDRRLCRVDCGHDVCSGSGVQAEGPGDPRHFSRRQHEAEPQQGIGVEDHEARHQDRGLQKSCQTQSDDLLHPLDKPIRIAAGNTEHIQTAHGDLNEQDSTALEVGEKHLDDGISHEDDAEDDHERAGDGTEAHDVLLGHFREAFHGLKLREGTTGNLADGSVPSDGAGEGPLQGDGQRIEPHGYCGEQGYRHKAFEDVQSRLPNVPSAGGILDAALKCADHQAYAEKRPAQLGKELHDGLHPG